MNSLLASYQLLCVATVPVMIGLVLQCLYLTLRSTIVLENLIVSGSRNFLPLMEPGNHNRVHKSPPESDESSSHSQTLFLEHLKVKGKDVPVL
jgi:hypothetical protein